MKNSFAGVAMFFLLALVACQDSKDDLKTSANSLSQYRQVGMQIPFDTGMEWIEYYKKEKASQGRLGLSLADYTISDNQAEDMLESVTGLVGVAFHYATDASSNLHIIAIPIDESLSVWGSIPGRIFVDTNTGNPISQSTAAAWATTYKNAHPNDIWFHFFGADIFEDITAVPFFDTIDIQPAINILTMEPQLLLVIWNEGTILGRKKEEYGVVFDASNACPPCGVE